MIAYDRITKQEVDYDIVEGGKIRVCYPDKFKFYATGTFQSMFITQANLAVAVDRSIQKTVKKPSFYEYPLSPLGKRIQENNVIVFPFPGDFDKWIVAIASKFQSDTDLELDSFQLKKLKNTFQQKYREQHAKALLSASQAAQMGANYDHVYEGHVLWAKDHALRACVALVELNAIDAKTVALRPKVVAIGEEEVIPEIDPYSSAIPVEEMAKYDADIAKKLRTDRDYLAKVLDAKKQREITARIKYASRGGVKSE